MILQIAIIGAVCPSTGQLVSHIWDKVDTQRFQKFLDDMAKEAPKKNGIKQIICLDNATWHKAKSLNWHYFRPEYLKIFNEKLTK